MRRAIYVLVAAILAIVMVSSPASAKSVPDQFGKDWADPRTAEKPVSVPDGESCRVQIVNHEFTNSDPVKSNYSPSKDCRGDWSKVVLSVRGTAAGHQSDRIGSIEVAGVPILKTSTPQPSADGIKWDVDKNVTPYAALFKSKHEVSTKVDTKLDAKNTAALHLKVRLTFYPATQNHAVPDSVADKISGLSNIDKSGSDTSGQLSVPRNTERLFADVYASGAGSNCEKAWYLSVPNDADRSCRTSSGSHREVQVLIDGQIAGIAAPYPQVYTGGFSNPYLWSTVPAPRSFDIRPASIDLTPYLPVLNDGKDHKISVQIAGMSAKSSGWSTPTAFRSWQDGGKKVVGGGLLASQTTKLAESTQTDTTKTGGEADMSASRQHTATGALFTSHGTVTTTVRRTLSYSSSREFTSKKSADSLEALWRDVETTTVLDKKHSVTKRTDANYGIDAKSSQDSNKRLSSEVELSDSLDVETSRDGETARHVAMNDSFVAEASWNRDTPASPEAEGTSQQRYRLSGDQPCYDHTIASKNGHFHKDKYNCGSAPG